jgi:NAD(P)-dependent dehydrogenase (short-subunit alcohol dehydrogenase family)
VKQLFDLKERCMVITGGGGVLGGTLATALAEAGAHVAVLDRDAAAARRVATVITEKAGRAAAILCDVTDGDSLNEAAQRVVTELGPPDGLVNAAGGNRADATTSPDLSFFDLSPDAVRSVLDLNLLGTVFPAQVFGRQMAARQRGAILNISSMSALRPLTNIPAYSAAKAAVSNFTRWLAVHMCRNYSPHLRVNAIAPGFFLTQQNRYLLTDQSTGELTPRGKTIQEHTPMARFGEPQDLVGTALWLLSDAAAYVTGVVVPVDGGFSAYGGV